MKKNYKLQNTNYKQITNYKIQITNKVAPFGHIINAFGERDAHELHELTRNKGSHGLHIDSFKLQTMTALIKSFCGGPGPAARGAQEGPSGHLVSCLIAAHNSLFSA